MTTTHYEVDRADAVMWLHSLPTEYAHAAIFDGPYCSGGFQEAKQRCAPSMGVVRDRDWFASDNMGTAGLVWLMRAVAVECHRVLKAGGWMLVFCDWRQSYNLAPAMESSGLRLYTEIMWDKTRGGQGLGFRSRHEKILAFVKDSPRWGTMDARSENVITCPPIHASKRKHPTEKPQPVLEYLVEATTLQGDLVIDAFAGSGSLIQACRTLDRSCHVCEREPRFVDVAKLRAGLDPGPLFGGSAA